MEKRIVLVVFFCWFFLCALAQNTDSKELLYEDFLFEIQDKFQLEYLDPEWVDLWDNYRENPIDLHHCDSNQLLQLNYFSPKQIQVLLNYRNKVKNIQSFYEIAQLYAWDKKSAMYLSLFVSLDKKLEFGVASRQYTVKSKSVFRTRWKSNIDTSLGGIPISFLIRTEGELNTQLSWNILLEQDANEPIYFPKKTYGFDFYSANLTYTPRKGILKKLVLGDYRIQFGEGLQIWGGSIFGGSILSATQRRGAFEVKPYKSTMETGYLRGIASQISVKKSDLLFLASSRFIDANSNEDSILYFTNLYLSGLHRSEKELISKNAIREDAIGIGWNYQTSKFKVGIMSSYYHWNAIWKNKEALYTLYKFEGNNLLNASVFVTSIGKFGLYTAEIAYSYPSGYAFMHFWTKELSSTWKMSLQQQYFDAHYFAPHGQATRSATNGVGEFVTNLNLQTELYKNLYLLGGLRYMQFDHMTYTIPEKHNKWNVFLRLNYYPSAQFETMFQTEYNNLPYSKTFDGVKYREYRNTLSNSFRMQYQFAKSWKIRSAIYVNVQEKEKQWGTGIGLQEVIQFQSEKLGLSWSFSYQYFSVDDYDLRAYAYEKTVTGMFENSAMYGEGHSLNCYLRYQKTRKWSVETKVKLNPKHSSYTGMRWDVILQFQYSFYGKKTYKFKTKPS